MQLAWLIGELGECGVFLTQYGAHLTETKELRVKPLGSVIFKDVQEAHDTPVFEHSDSLG